MPIYRLDDIEPRIHESCWIAPDAVVIGNVSLAEGVGVWFGAVLRGDNEPIEIGPGTNIQDHCVLHTDPGFPVAIGANCTVGHRAIVHGAIVGDDALIGMGATLLNGARIGSNCIVGANALVTEGKTFEENSLIVGAPAKQIRQLDQQAANAIRANALTYIKNRERFAAGLRRLD